MIRTDVRLVRCSNAAPPSRLPGLDRAINPYRGCAHACAYCYAQDVTRFDTDRAWGSAVEAKVNIVPKLKKELGRGLKGVYGVGTVTDPYQPIERKHQLTRGCLSLLRRHGAEASVLTKSDLVLRDIGLLRGWDSVEVGMSIACVDARIASVVEPEAPPPAARMSALSELAAEGVDVYLMAAPILPGVSDSEDLLERLVEAAGEAGVRRVMWDQWNPKPMASVRLRLALEAASMRLRADARKTEGSTRSTLSALCRSRGMRMIDAF